MLAKRTFCNDENVLYLCCQLHVTFEHLIMANVTEELNFLCYLIFISVNLKLKSHIYLISSILDSIRLNRLTGCSEVPRHYCTGSFSVRQRASKVPAIIEWYWIVVLIILLFIQYSFHKYLLISHHGLYFPRRYYSEQNEDKYLSSYSIYFSGDRFLLSK